MTKKIFKFWTLAVSLSLLMFTACSSDDDDLVLEKSEIEVNVGSAQTLKINEGNGGYTVSSANTAIATVKMENNAVIIEGMSVGETSVTVKDKEDKTATVKVKVTPKDNAQAVAGTYAGELTVVESDNPPVAAEYDIKINRAANNEINLVLEDFSLREIPVGTISLDGIILEEVNKIVTIKETTKTIVLENFGGISADILVNGTFENNKLNLNLNISALGGMITVVATFDGDKK